MNKKSNMTIDSHQSNIMLTKKYLKSKIMCPETKFRHYNKEYQYILNLVKSTLEMGESNSALLIGPQFSGKTTLVNSVLKDLFMQKSFNDNALVVKLHGLLHTDDRLALKDITRQMQLENVIGDKVFGTFAENLNFLLSCLKAGDKKHSKPVIFILDEFDLFCEHNNQTLLYNLFDVAQSSQVPLCVLGITCRLDVIELLEKRVKSRFSHRQIFLFPDSNLIIGKESTAFDNRLKLLEHLLELSEDKNNENETANNLKINSKFKCSWNEHIQILISNSTITNLLKQMYQIDTNERSFRNFLAVVVSVLSEDHSKIEVNDFVEASKIFTQDDKIAVLNGLSVLEICLIIAMKHETEIYDGEPLNFEAVFNRYIKFVNQNSSLESVQRPVIMKAFEHLRNLEILVPISNVNLKIEKEYQYYKFLLTSQQVVEAVKNYPELPTEVFQWSMSSI